MDIKFRTEGVELRIGRKQFRNLHRGDNAMFNSDNDIACEERLYMRRECPLYEKEKKYI